MSLKIYKSEKLALALLLIATGGMGTAIGMSFPLVSLLLARAGFSALLIGINTAMGSLGILVIGLYTAKVLGRHGAFIPIIGASILGAGSLLALPFIEQPAGWFILRFTLAVGLGFLWLLTESWLNILSNNTNRGKVIGLYAAFFSGGFALGPLIVTGVGTLGVLPFAIAALMVLISMFPMLVLAERGVAKPTKPVHQFGLVRLAPFVFVIAFAGGLFETTAFALLPVYTLTTGLSESFSLYALSAFCGGGIALQYPLGRFADIAGRRALTMLSASGVLVCLIILPFVIEQMELLMPLLFVFGGLVFGLYTAGLVMLGDKYSSENLVSANAMFIIFYEAGALFGPALSGGAMDLWPQYGFVGFLQFMSVLLVATIIFRNLRRTTSGSSA